MMWKNSARVGASLLVVLVTLGVLAIMLTGCQIGDTGDKQKPKSHLFYDYFDTYGSIYDYTGGSQEEFDEIVELADSIFKEYHILTDIYNEYDGINNLCTVNENAKNGPVKVSEKLIELIEFSKEMYNKTDGNVNIALGSVLKIWHAYREEGKAVPSYEILSAAAEHTDINKIKIDKEASTIEFLDKEMSIDVGSIAKGYAVEVLAQALSERNISGYAIDMGGNLRIVGTKPSGDGWISGITDPTQTFEGGYIYKTELKNNSLVTSGTYQRFYTVDGVRYHHIIDKDTLMPENNYISVSIIYESSAVCDALSTAIFNMTVSEAEAVLAQFPGASAIFLNNDGAVTVIGALKG